MCQKKKNDKFLEYGWACNYPKEGKEWIFAEIKPEMKKKIHILPW